MWLCLQAVGKPAYSGTHRCQAWLSALLDFVLMNLKPNWSV